MNPKLFGGILMFGFGAMELFMRRGETAKRVRPTVRDRGTTLAIVTAYALAVLAVTSRVLPTVILFAAVAWCGIALSVVGFAIRVWAMDVLERFYTRTLVTTKDQHVVRDGPYRLIRHPGYLGSMLVWIGAATSSANLVVVVAVVVLMAMAYGYRIRVEERILVEAFGEEYADYRRSSWRLVPYVF